MGLMMGLLMLMFGNVLNNFFLIITSHITMKLSLSCDDLKLINGIGNDQSSRNIGISWDIANVAD